MLTADGDWVVDEDVPIEPARTSPQPFVTPAAPAVSTGVPAAVEVAPLVSTDVETADAAPAAANANVLII